MSSELDYNTLCDMVDLLASKDYDANAMVLQLAKTNPQLFCALAKITHPVAVVAWHATVVDYIKSGNQYVSAIKELRTATGWGLKEAKDVCDEVRWYMHSNRYMYMSDPMHPNNLHWTDAQRALIEELCKVADRLYK